jgi:hypothetical protein
MASHHTGIQLCDVANFFNNDVIFASILLDQVSRQNVKWSEIGVFLFLKWNGSEIL